MLKNERLQREREEYEGLTPEQKRRRDLRDEKKAKKVASSKRHRVRTLPTVFRTILITVSTNVNQTLANLVDLDTFFFFLRFLPFLHTVREQMRVTKA